MAAPKGQTFSGSRLGYARSPVKTKGDVVNEDQVKGTAKQAEGEAQESWGDAKDNAGDAVDDVKEKAGDLKDKVGDMIDRDEEKDEAAKGTRSS